MKNIKSLLVFLCMGAAFAACSDDENINVGDTTVQFQSASMRISEVTTALDIPIEVTGSHEGTVKVSVQYIESNGLKDDSNVIITSRELLIPAGVSTVDLETRLSVANDEMEEGRVLTFKIVDVVGATLGSNATCEVSLKEASPIEGSYALTGLDLATGAVGSILCTLTLSETDANTLLLDFGMGATVPVQLYPGDKEGDYQIVIPGLSEIGGGLSLALFDYASMSLYEDDFLGYFDGETQIITLQVPGAYFGMCFVDMSSLSLYYAWVAYPDPENEDGIIPLQMIKQ